MTSQVREALVEDKVFPDLKKIYDQIRRHTDSHPQQLTTIHDFLEHRTETKRFCEYEPLLSAKVLRDWT